MTLHRVGSLHCPHAEQRGISLADRAVLLRLPHHDGSQAISTVDHFSRLRRWIQQESDAEAARLASRRARLDDADAERSGESLLDLVIVDHETGLGGHYLLTLIKRNREPNLPWNRLKVGSPVVMTNADGDAYTGVVSSRDVEKIQVAVNEWPDGESYRIDLSPDEISRKRQLLAISVAETAVGRLGQLRRILLGEREPKFSTPPQLEFHDELDASQQQAIEFALSAVDIAVIHGPPGTGKTTTVAEMIRQAVARGDSVLACAPSNTAVDNLLERLIGADQNVVRLGHPARVSAELREHSLDALVENQPHLKIVQSMMREAESLYRKAGKYTRAKPARGARQQLRQEARQLQKDARLLERQAVAEVIDRADVVCATLAFDGQTLGERRFDLCVIDEACQSTEPSCWIPLLRADRVVLTGDHCQLPPTVVSEQAAGEGFGVSLQERIVEHYGPSVSRRLTTQYRMHEHIMQFSSMQFYDGELEAHGSVRIHRLAGLPNVSETPLTREPVTFIDTAGADFTEEQEPEGTSLLNPQEGRLVLRKVDELLAAGVSSRQLAIIAPYAAQVRWLRDQANNSDLEIDTVDGFQGREKEAVLITLVRSNGDGEIGFLADTRRMNVALTRARRKLIVIGDSATLGQHPFYDALLSYFESIGSYHTVWED